MVDPMSIFLVVAVVISAGFFLICYDEAITRFRSDRKWGVFVAPVSLLLPYFYQPGSDTVRRKANAWTIVFFLLALGLVFYS